MLHVRRSILVPLVSLALCSAAGALAGCAENRESVRDAPRPVPAASASSERLVNHHSVPRSGALQLHRAWHIPMEHNVTGAPLCDGGVIYAGDWGGNVFAVEAATGRYKRVIGNSLRSRKHRRQVTEAAIAANALNRMLELGRPRSVRIS